MFYGIDSDGQLVSSYFSDVLTEDYQELFPDDIGDIPGFEHDEISVSTGDLQSNVSSGDSYFYSVLPDNYVTYDDIIDLLASIPSYNVYPNTAAVNVFDGVFRSSCQDGFYIVHSGADSSYTYMYYSQRYEVSGNTITLLSPVTLCTYYSTRSGSTTLYNYTVSQVGDISITPGTQLIYTNCLPGYPSLPSDDRQSGFSHSFLDLGFIGLLIIVYIILFSTLFRRH